jgi:hypothetical protein
MARPVRNPLPNNTFDTDEQKHRFALLLLAD